MRNTTQLKNCPKCNATIPANSPGGLCPKCVLRSAASQQEPVTPAQSEVPPISKLAPFFPQLEILELIGRGGMGFVFKARQPHLDRVVALKVLPEELAADPHFAERFNREARFLAKLNHPNIVSVHDFGCAGGFYFLVMEYVDGLNLRQAMRAGRFSPAEALAIVPKVCEALQYAHEQGVLHRDIKPENLLLDTRGRIKIADFGIAKLVGEDHTPVTLTGTGSSLGTPHYMAPEQLENPAHVDHRADIYSLGVVFYEMLTGELPLGRFAPPSSRAPLDERIDEIVLRALAKERELRQKDAREMQTQVEGVSSSILNDAREKKPAVEETAASSNGSGNRRWTGVFAGRYARGAAIAVISVLLTLFVLRLKRPVNSPESHMTVEMSEFGPVSSEGSPPLEPAPLFFATNVFVNASEKDPQNETQDQMIAEAREQFEQVKNRHRDGLATNLELHLANRDLAIAEARGNALATAKAEYQFALWKFEGARKEGDRDILWATELDLYKADRAISLAKAGTDSLLIAQADLKFAEMAFGQAVTKKNSGAISEEDYNKAVNELQYAQMHFRRMRENQPSKP